MRIEGESILGQTALFRQLSQRYMSAKSLAPGAELV